MTLLQYILGFGFFFLILYLIKRFFDRIFNNYAKELEKIMAALAKKYGLNSRQEKETLGDTNWAPPSLFGKVNGLETSIEIVQRGAGDDTRLVFCVEIMIKNPQRFHLELYRNNIVNRGLFGQTQFDLGDPAFQKHFIFRAAKPALLPEVLDEEIRAKALSIRNSFYMDQIRLKGNKIHFERHALHQKRSVKKFRNILDLLFQIAAKVDQF